MVDNFFFPHTCEVKRYTGEFDAEGFEIFELIYIGECGYQPTNNGYNASGVAILTSPNVILPENEAVFKVNDVVVITLPKGRSLNATVESFEDVEDSDIGGTTLWLKQASDE